MKRKILSILLALCLALTLLPVAAFAEGSEEELPVCTCETACAVESLNADCPVCGAEGASAENCAKYVKPADDVPTQSESEPVVLNSEGETVIELTQSNISNYMSSGLTDGSYKLGENVTVETGSLEVKGTVTLDLNGHTLLFKDPELYYPPEQGQVNAGIRVYNSDSSESAAKYALTLCDTSTAKTGTLNVWGESMAESGEGLFVGQNGELTMTGGTITDSSGTNPWGIGIGIIEGRVTMTGGKIENQTRCGVTLAGGTFEMSGDAVISNCGGNNSGGGIWIGGGTLTMTGGTIRNCKATQGGGVYVGAGTFNMSDGSIAGCTAATTGYTTYAMGGGVYVGADSTFNMSGGSIVDCKASADGSSAFGGGIRNDGHTTLSGTAEIRDCQATGDYSAYGGGISDGGTLNISGDVKITGCTDGGFDTEAMVIFSGTISGGTFDGTVANNGTITGGTFNGKVTNSRGGTITGGTFNDGITGPGTIIATGSGTETDPYQISTAAGLKWFRDVVNGANSQTQNRGACAVLTADIVLDSNEAWTSIGYVYIPKYGDLYFGSPYMGTFDGQGHIIKGLYVDIKANNVYMAPTGLFGHAKDATIKNLTVTGRVLGNRDDSGGIAGTFEGGSIENCGNQCDVISEYDLGYIGGIAGYIDSASVSGCYNTGKISGALTRGGIIGTTGSGTIRDCYNTGAVIGNPNSGGGYVGGIVGFNGSGDKTPDISNCYNVGTVTGLAPVGGIVDWNYGKVQNCYFLDSAAGVAIGENRPEYNGTVDEATGPKSAAEFADGTVLKALINDLDDSPWDSACKYLDGKTLPVFKWQKLSAHEHSGKWTSNGDGTHTRTCDCGVTETAKCSGGTATRTAKAVCQVCGQPYGQLASGGGIRRQPTGGSGAANTSDTTKTVKSGNTGDMGVALYAGMALLSMTGGAWVVGKKRK